MFAERAALLSVDPVLWPSSPVPCFVVSPCDEEGDELSEDGLPVCPCFVLVPLAGAVEVSCVCEVPWLDWSLPGPPSPLLVGCDGPLSPVLTSGVAVLVLLTVLETLVAMVEESTDAEAARAPESED